MIVTTGAHLRMPCSPPIAAGRRRRAPCPGARCYEALPERVLFLHGHENAWHQRLPVSTIVERCRRLAEASELEYLNVNDRVVTDWLRPGSGMVMRVGLEWEARLREMLGEPITSAAPTR